MKKLLAFALLALASAPGLAANNYTIKDSTGATVTFCAKDTGSSILASCHVLTDSSGTPFGTVSNPLYFGNTSFTLGAGSSAIGTVGVTALPSLPAGSNAIGSVGVTALPSLPAGSNAIGSVAVSVLPQPADTTGSAAIDMTAANNVSSFAPAGQTGVWAEITGTWTGTLTFQKLYGSTWVTTSAIPAGTGNLATSTATANGVFIFDGAATQQLRAIDLATGTGSPTVRWGGTNGAAYYGMRSSTAENAKVSAPAVTTGGATPYHLVTAATTNSTLIAAGAHTLYSLTLTGLNTTAAYVHLYDAATAPASCGATATPVHTWAVIGSATVQGGLVVPLPTAGEAYVSGIALCVTGAAADSDNSAGPAGVLVNASYK